MLKTITDPHVPVERSAIQASVDAAFALHQICITDGLRNFLHVCAGLTLDGITKQVKQKIGTYSVLSLTEITEQAKQNIAACDAFVADFVREIHNFFACIILGAVSSSACKWAMENIVACAANIPALSTATTVVC